MLPYFNKYGYGHPSITNRPGWEAYEAIYEASEQIKKSIGAEFPEEINFTHNFTEANNLAITGTALANKTKGKEIIISEIEHYSVMFPCEELQRKGFKLIKIPVDKEGFVDLDKLSSAVNKNTLLVSIMAVNHEIGTIEPLKEIVEIVKDKNPETIFHTDASDAYTKTPLNVKRTGVDLLTLSSHKIHGPRGAGALYVKKGVEVEKIIYGSLSSQPLWPGVENVPAIMGFSKASSLAFKKFKEYNKYLENLRDKLIKGILEEVPDTLLNGPLGNKRVSDNANISFLRVEGEAVTVELSLHGIYVSSGSACTSRVLEPSHVLLAIGRKYEEAHGSVLFKLMRFHKREDIEYTLKVIPKSIKRLRKISAIKS